MTTTSKANAIVAAAQTDADVAAMVAAANLVRDENIALVSAEMETLGAAFAAGSVALTDAAIYFGQQVAAELVTENDASVLYLAFANASNKARTRGAPFVKADAKSAKTDISTFKTFGRPTVARVVAEVPSLYDDAAIVFDAMDRKLTNSAYQSFAKINRAIDELLLKSTASTPDAAVAEVVAKIDREWFTTIMTKKPAESVDVLAKVAKVIEGLVATCEDAPFAAGIGDEVKALSVAMAALVAAETAKAEVAKANDDRFRLRTGASNVVDMLAAA
jgi:hypothetical protein